MSYQKRSSVMAPSTSQDLWLPGGSQSQEVDDQRFVELLKPIKDLTVNWEVPLSRYLENYIEELVDLDLNLESSRRDKRASAASKVNFVEAALLLQGTASVYSKKVEFLWQNVLKMLDLLASQKALEETLKDGEGGAEGKKGRGRRRHDYDDFSLVFSDVARNTNLKSDLAVNEKIRDRKMTLNFITVTPRQLIEKEGREQKCVKVNVYARGTAKDLLGQKEDFRVNSQFTLTTAIVGEDLGGGESDLGHHSVSLFEDSQSFMETSLLQPVMSPPRHEDITEKHNKSNKEAEKTVEKVPDKFDSLLATQNHQHGPVEVLSEVNDDGDAFDDAPHMEVDHHDDDDIEEDPNKMKRPRRNKLEESLNEPKAPLGDPWEVIKPHEATVPPKPAKKGRTCKAPSNVVLKKALSRQKRVRKAPDELEEDPNRKKVQVTVPVEEYLIHEKVTHKYHGKSRLVAPEFQELAHEENKERRRMEKEDGVEDKAESQATPEEEAVIDDDGWEAFEGGAGDDVGVGDEEVRASDAALLSAMLPDDEAAGPSSQEGGDTYEELVMKRVAAYVQQSQEYIESTDLAKRVSKWHEDIKPRLERVEKRGNFDIHKYGSDILGSFPEDERKTTVPFEKVVKGKDKEEVCRYFLSTLMLANTYNIELKHKGDVAKRGAKMEDLPMDGVEMTLLSTRRHFEDLLDYEAPSQDEERAALGKRKKAKGKKNLADE